MDNMKLCLTVIAVVAIIVGVTCIKKWFDDKSREKVIVAGQITGFEEDTDGNRDVYFYPVFEYLYNGQVYRCKGRLGSATMKKGKKVPMSKYKAGDEIEVMVFTDEPSGGIINTHGNINLMLYMGVGAVLLGVLFAVFAVWMFII